MGKFQKTNVSENQLVLGGCWCTLFKSALLCCCMLCSKLIRRSVSLTAVQRTQLPFDNENSGVFLHQAIVLLHAVQQTQPPFVDKNSGVFFAPSKEVCFRIKNREQSPAQHSVQIGSFMQSTACKHLSHCAII